MSLSRFRQEESDGILSLYNCTLHFVDNNAELRCKAELSSSFTVSNTSIRNESVQERLVFTTGDIDDSEIGV